LQFRGWFVSLFFGFAEKHGDGLSVKMTVSYQRSAIGAEARGAASLGNNFEKNYMGKLREGQGGPIRNPKRFQGVFFP
jgi:hypothetical protein